MIPVSGLICDLLWSDPDAINPGWSMSPRLLSFTFDNTILEKFCDKHNIDLIVRGHQISEKVNI